MPSKTSKRNPRTTRSTPALPRLWRAARGCSEDATRELARALAEQLRPGDRVLLEGALGAGKSTFARWLLLAIGVRQPPEGSPTFAIAHEYDWPAGRTEGCRVVHADLYRIRSEGEIDETGLPDVFWDDRVLLLAEWVSLWPVFQARVLGTPNPGGRNWQVRLSLSDGNEPARDLEIRLL